MYKYIHTYKYIRIYIRTHIYMHVCKYMVLTIVCTLFWHLVGELFLVDENHRKEQRY